MVSTSLEQKRAETKAEIVAVGFFLKKKKRKKRKSIADAKVNWTHLKVVAF